MYWKKIWSTRILSHNSQLPHMAVHLTCIWKTLQSKQKSQHASKSWSHIILVWLMSKNTQQFWQFLCLVCFGTFHKREVREGQGKTWDWLIYTFLVSLLDMAVHLAGILRTLQKSQHASKSWKTIILVRLMSKNTCDNVDNSCAWFALAPFTKGKWGTRQDNDRSWDW